MNTPIITDGLETSIPRADLEQKWYDSLLFHKNDRPNDITLDKIWKLK